MSGGNPRGPVREGELVGGRYRIERVIGMGAMGVVVSARDERLDARVAIKFLLPQALEHPQLVARFSREARAAVRIQNEHVARVMDTGALDSGAPFMVMEYLEGRDLSSELEKRGPLPVDDVVDFVLQASEALMEAHELGFVHRDLKPANLFLVERRGARVVKVLDFGISKFGGVLGGMTGSEGAMTQTASLLGSPLYMSPEQMDSAKTVDARTDIWALGVIMYELLTAKPPFHGDSVPQLCMAIVNQQPAPLRASRPDVSPALETVVFRCLEKDRDRRFGSIAELALALSDFAPSRSMLSLERIRSHAVDGVRAAEHRGGASASGALSRPGSSSRDRSSGAPSGSGEVTDWATRGSTETGWAGTQAQRRSSYARVAAVGVPILLGAGVAVTFLLRSHPGAEAAGSASASAAPPASSTHGDALPASPATLAPQVRGDAPVITPQQDPVVTGTAAAAAESSQPPTAPAPAPTHRASSAGAKPAGRPSSPVKPHRPESWEDDR